MELGELDNLEYPLINVMNTRFGFTLYKCWRIFSSINPC